MIFFSSSIERVFLGASAIYWPKSCLNICPPVITTIYDHFSHFANNSFSAKYRGPAREPSDSLSMTKLKRSKFF